MMNIEINIEMNIICIICIIISSINIYMYRYNCIIQNENNLNLLKIIYWDEQKQNEQKNDNVLDDKTKIINNTLNALNYIIDSNNEMMSKTQILLDKN